MDFWKAVLRNANVDEFKIPDSKKLISDVKELNEQFSIQKDATKKLKEEEEKLEAEKIRKNIEALKTHIFSYEELPDLLEGRSYGAGVVKDEYVEYDLEPTIRIGGTPDILRSDHWFEFNTNYAFTVGFMFYMTELDYEQKNPNNLFKDMSKAIINNDMETLKNIGIVSMNEEKNVTDFLMNNIPFIDLYKLDTKTKENTKLTSPINLNDIYKCPLEYPIVNGSDAIIYIKSYERFHGKDPKTFGNNIRLITKVGKGITQPVYVVDDLFLEFALYTGKKRICIIHFNWDDYCVDDKILNVNYTVASNIKVNEKFISEIMVEENTILIYSSASFPNIPPTKVHKLNLGSFRSLIYTNYINIFTHNVGLISKEPKLLEIQKQYEYINDKISETINNRFPTIGLFQEIPPDYSPRFYDENNNIRRYSLNVRFSDQWSYITDHSNCKPQCKERHSGRIQHVFHKFAIVFSKHFDYIKSYPYLGECSKKMKYDPSYIQAKRISDGVLLTYLNKHYIVYNTHLQFIDENTNSIKAEKRKESVKEVLRDAENIKNYYEGNCTVFFGGDFNISGDDFSKFISSVGYISDIQHIELKTPTNLTDDGKEIRLDYLVTTDNNTRNIIECVEERNTIFDHNLVSYQIYLN